MVMNTTRTESEPDIAPILDIFTPLLVDGFMRAEEEPLTNREFHLGPKEYTAVVTLTGHEPVRSVIYVDKEPVSHA